VPSLRTIKRRTRSVRNIAQITKAMEMIAATRMRRAQQRVLASRPYADRLQQLIADLASRPNPEGETQPLLLQRETRDRVALIVMTSDRGLCGGLNANVLRQATQQLLDCGGPQAADVITVGRKGQDFMARRGVQLRATFTQLGDQPGILEIQPIAKIIIDDFIADRVDAAYVVFPKFVSTLVQRVNVCQILPVVPSEMEGPQLEYIFEPSAPAILSELLPRYVEIQVYQSLLETIASEHSARMVAMRNATDNAKELIENLTLVYNKARQAAITKEITEIAVGADALSG
jgi:F-type H+-transporting ATPase subunit gamma